jgi:hypothetical protein
VVESVWELLAKAALAPLRRNMMAMDVSAVCRIMVFIVVSFAAVEVYRFLA